MAAVGLAILLGIAIFISIVGIGFIVWILVTGNDSTNDGIIGPPCSTIDKSILPSASEFPCVAEAVVPTLDRLTIGYAPLSVISTFPTYYNDACASLCQSVSCDSVGNNCICINTNSENVQDTYDKCIEQLKPVGCQGTAKPVAIDGNQPYYVNHFVGSDENVQRIACP